MKSSRRHKAPTVLLPDALAFTLMEGDARQVLP